ncbi:MAG TPA: hypothetical protein VGI39_08685, partial [Polyangiaceae bacterium]
MAQAPELDFQAFVARKAGERPSETRTSEAKAGESRAEPSSGHEYAYSFDRKTRETFERMKPVELVVGTTVRMFK